MATTRKKVKIIGTETYIRQSDGTIEDMQVISVEERDFNFHKIWLEHILTSIDIIGNQKTKLAFWIMNNLNRDNQLIMTQREIAKKTNMSTKTVNATIKALLESNFLQKTQLGVYRVNPEILFKGNTNNRMNVLLQYQEVRAENEKIKQVDEKPTEKQLDLNEAQEDSQDIKTSSRASETTQKPNKILPSTSNRKSKNRKRRGA